jgi:hypothetical protein
MPAHLTPRYSRADKRRLAAYTTLGVCAGWCFGGIVAVTTDVYLWFVVLALLCMWQAVAGFRGWI